MKTFKHISPPVSGAVQSKAPAFGAEVDGLNLDEDNFFTHNMFSFLLTS